MSSENILTRIDRCLEEGAEDYLVKPVKLADVKRLRDFIMRGEGEDNGHIETHKRKLLDNFISIPSSPSLLACNISTSLPVSLTLPTPSSPSSSIRSSKRPRLHD